LNKNQIYSFYIDNSENDGEGEIICNNGKCHKIDVSISLSNEFLEISKINLTERKQPFTLYIPNYVGKLLIYKIR
jgi:hypothetical protein